MIDLNCNFHRGLFSAACERDYVQHFEAKSGLAAIAAGMNWGPDDFVAAKWQGFKNENNIHELREEWEPFIKALDVRKEKWLNYIKDKDNYIDFHRKYIHN